jgi:four helix bundle protein
VAFDHERLDVYKVALAFLTVAEKLVGTLPRGRSHLADQLTRASLSIVLNIAEGAGKTSAADKRRYYLCARGSATESAALLDVYARLELASPNDHQEGKQMLERIVSMLVRLAKSFEGG